MAQRAAPAPAKHTSVFHSIASPINHQYTHTHTRTLSPVLPTLMHTVFRLSQQGLCHSLETPQLKMLKWVCKTCSTHARAGHLQRGPTRPPAAAACQLPATRRYMLQVCHTAAFPQCPVQRVACSPATRTERWPRTAQLASYTLLLNHNVCRGINKCLQIEEEA